MRCACEAPATPRSVFDVCVTWDGRAWGVGYTENEGGRKTGGDMNGQKKHMLLGSAPATITGRSRANRIRGQLNIGFVVTGMFRIGDARDGGEE